jgi:hypothetical protein
LNRMLAPSHYFQRAVHEIERNYKSLGKSQRIRVERWVEKLVNSGGNAAWNRHRNAYVKLLLMMVLKKKLEEPFHILPADGQLPPFPSHLKVLLKQTSDLHANEFWRDLYDRMDVLDTTSHSNMTYRQHLENEVEEIITASHGNQHSFLNHDMSAISAAHSHAGYPEGKEGSTVKNRTIRSPNQGIRSPALSAMHTSRATTHNNLNNTTMLGSPTRAHSPYRQTKHVSINESHMQGSPAKSPNRQAHHKPHNNKSRVQPAGYAPRPVHNEPELDAEYGRLWGNVSHARIPHETEALRAMVREQMVRIEILEQQLQDTTVKYEEEIQSLRHQHIRELTELKDNVGNKSYLRSNNNDNNGNNYRTIGNTSTLSNSIRNPEYLEATEGHLSALDNSIYDVPSPSVTTTMEPNHSEHSPNASIRSSHDYAREYNSLEFEKGIGAGIASGTIGGGTDMDASMYDPVSSSVNPVGVKMKNDMYGSPDRESTASGVPKVHHIHMASPPPKNWKVDIDPIPTIDRNEKRLERKLALEYQVSNNDDGKIKHPDELASSIDASLGGPLAPMSTMPGPIALPSSSTDSLSATVLTQRWVNESSNGLSLTLTNQDRPSSTLIPVDPTTLDDSTMKSFDEDKHFLEYLEDFQSDLKKDSQVVVFDEH